MANYDFTSSLPPLDFKLLSKDLLEAELGILLENFRDGRDKGIDLRYAPQSILVLFANQEIDEVVRNVFPVHRFRELGRQRLLAFSPLLIR
jgi:hypothetical protein